MKVNDGYELFKQFAMTTVSSEDIAKRFPTKKGNKLSDLNMEIPKL
jgi:hypothetical protein